MQDFMNGRHGADDLTYLLGGVGMVLALIGSLAVQRWLGVLALIVIAVALWRAFSTNHEARERENATYLEILGKIPVIGQFATGSKASAGKADFARAKRTAQKMWNGRKDTMYFRCKNCGQILSVPRGKGRIRVTCPKCGTQVEKKS